MDPKRYMGYTGIHRDTWDTRGHMGIHGVTLGYMGIHGDTYDIWDTRGYMGIHEGKGY
jgi:hypothetical protein